MPTLLKIHELQINGAGTKLLSKHLHQIGAIVYELCDTEALSVRQCGEREGVVVSVCRGIRTGKARSCLLLCRRFGAGYPRCQRHLAEKEQSGTAAAVGSRQKADADTVVR